MEIILLSTFVLLIITQAFLFLNNTIYCNIFERYEVKIYNKLNKLDISDFYKVGFEYHTCTYPAYHILLWDDGLASVHIEYNCIACTFYKRGARKLYKKLKNIE